MLKKKLEEAAPDQEALDTLQAQLSSSQDAVAQLEKYKEQHKVRLPNRIWLIVFTVFRC